jgi:hypothetical protein
MFSIGLHCRLIGRPGKIAGLIRFLDHAQAKGGVWFATPGEIAATGPRPTRTVRANAPARWTAPLRRPLRRHLRTFPLDRRTRLGAGTRPRA